MMIKFRKEKVDLVGVVDAESRKELTNQIVAVGQDHILIDVQYAVATEKGKLKYSALLLLRKKKGKK